MRFVETPLFTGVVQSRAGIYYWSPSEKTILHVDRVREARARGLDTRADQTAKTAGTGGAGVRTREFNRLVAGIKQAGMIRRGQLKPGRVFEFQPVDVRAIRLKLKKSQSEFALMIGVSIATLQNWEQGRRRPEGPARALLKVAAANPRAVERALSA
jgi:putative transcriptional regulator